MLTSPNVEMKLVEQNLLVNAIYEVPFKVTMESDKFSCFQWSWKHLRDVIVAANPMKIYFTSYTNAPELKLFGKW